MNFNPFIHHLGQYATREQWQNTTPELCREVISKILGSEPTRESWLALLELLGTWPSSQDVALWVGELEPEIEHWPWEMRHSFLGQQHTRGDRACVYRLVGFLHIENIEDGGPKLKKWSGNENWQKLKGIGLYRVETDAKDLAIFLQSPNLKQLETLELRALDSLSGKLDLLFGKTELLQLRELNLLSLNLQSVDLVALKQSPIGEQLSRLNLSGNFIHDRDLPLLLSPGGFKKLQVLDLSYNSISAAALERALTNLDHPSLDRIVFEGTAAEQYGTREQ